MSFLKAVKSIFISAIPMVMLLTAPTYAAETVDNKGIEQPSMTTIYTEFSELDTRDSPPAPSTASAEPISGIDYVVSVQEYNFDNGTEEGILQTGDAIIYTVSDGVEFIFPVDYDKSHQLITPQQIIDIYYKVPERLRDLGHKEIVFRDVYNPQDGYWRTVYKTFSASYATSGKYRINFWRYDELCDDTQILGFLCHELTHKIDLDYMENGIPFSQQEDWKAAMEQDAVREGVKSVSLYGENSESEDFAESFRAYIENPNYFKKAFPNRAKIVAEFLSYKAEIVAS